jgi:hypothetical protein
LKIIFCLPKQKDEKHSIKIFEKPPDHNMKRVKCYHQHILITLWNQQEWFEYTKGIIRSHKSKKDIYIIPWRNKKEQKEKQRSSKHYTEDQLLDWPNLSKNSVFYYNLNNDFFIEYAVEQTCFDLFFKFIF